MIAVDEKLFEAMLKQMYKVFIKRFHSLMKNRLKLTASLL